MGKTVVLDTNVLLADPNAVLSFPWAEVVIPETVLGELDKLKTARVDPDLRFRGREVSRLLFDLSEEGSLVDGVTLPDGGRLRVAPFEADSEIPEGLATRNADDRILAVAYQVCKAGDGECDVTLVTNDLNMLLKAQTLGIPVQRHGDGVEGSFSRRFIIRPFQRYKIPIMILAIAIAVFAAVIILSLGMQRPRTVTGTATLPAEFKSLLSQAQQQAFDALNTLQSKPNDPEALLAMGNFYFNMSDSASRTDPVAMADYAKQGVRYYDRYLTQNASDNDARVDYATLLYRSGQTDKAIQEVLEALKRDKNHVNGNYNLGLFYWQGRRDYQSAVVQFEKVIELTKNDSNQHGVYQQAVAILKQVQDEAKAAGRPVDTTQGVVTQ